MGLEAKRTNPRERRKPSQPCGRQRVLRTRKTLNDKKLFCSMEDIVRKMNNQGTGWEKIRVSDKGRESGNIKNLYNSGRR